MLLPIAVLAQGKTLRFASAFDPQSMDPHALALLYQTRVVTQVYEGLVNRDKNFKLEPSLAAVVADGEPDDVALQAAPERQVPRRLAVHRRRRGVLDRARAGRRPRSAAYQMRGITGAKKVDEQTIEIAAEAPDAVLPEKL